MGVTNYLSPRMMRMQFRKLLLESHKKLNGERKGPGHACWLMRCFYETNATIKKTFIDETHSSCEDLWWYNRPRSRGSQPCEVLSQRKLRWIESSGRATLDSWIALASVLEKLLWDRICSLRTTGVWKTKNKKLLAKDHIYENIMKLTISLIII